MIPLKDIQIEVIVCFKTELTFFFDGSIEFYKYCQYLKCLSWISLIVDVSEIELGLYLGNIYSWKISWFFNKTLDSICSHSAIHECIY
jgi:hypothetical protein